MMGTPKPDLEIQGKFQEEMPYTWGLQNVAIRQGGLVDVGTDLGLKPCCVHLSFRPMPRAPGMRKQG